VRGGSNEESKAWLDANSKKAGVITLPSGLQYKVLKEGSGGFHPTIDSSCLCHYEGKLIDGTVFDSSYERGDPTSFAPNQVIKGWTEAMQMMVEGDKWEMYIPSELAYGDRGSPPKIKGGDALIFQMEVIKIEGDKTVASRCNVSTLEKCTEKEKAYVAKVKSFDVDEIDTEVSRIERIMSGSVADTLLTWANLRVRILKELRSKLPSEEL